MFAYTAVCVCHKFFFALLIIISHHNMVFSRLFLLIYKEYLTRSSSSIFNHTLIDLLNVHHSVDFSNHNANNNSNNNNGYTDHHQSNSSRGSTITTTTTKQKKNDMNNQRAPNNFKQHLQSLFSYYKSVVKQSVWLYESDKYFLQLFYEIQLQSGDCNQANLISWRMNKV